MRTTTVLRRGALFVALVLLASSLVGVTICLTGCKADATEAGMPSKYVDSYEELQQGFSGKNGAVFPDLSVFNFSASSVKYRLDWTDYSENALLTTYVVYGDGSIEESSMHITFSCYDGNASCVDIPDPIEYNGVKIRHDSYENENSYGEGYSVYVGGFEYGVDTTFDIGKTLNEAELNELRTNVRNTLYPFICGIIDAAQTN